MRITKLVVPILLFVFSPGCKKQSPSAAPGAETPAAPAAAAPDRYTLKGIVKSINAAEREVNILHQAIPTFKNRDGEVVGMMSMVMPFGVAEGVDLGPLKPGQKIEFTFEMLWKGKAPNQITQVTVLPETEEIKFGGE
jgi:Cu/Ag efflux protein CusF